MKKQNEARVLELNALQSAVAKQPVELSNCSNAWRVGDQPYSCPRLQFHSLDATNTNVFTRFTSTVCLFRSFIYLGLVPEPGTVLVLEQGCAEEQTLLWRKSGSQGTDEVTGNVTVKMVAPFVSGPCVCLYQRFSDSPALSQALFLGANMNKDHFHPTEEWKWILKPLKFPGNKCFVFSLLPSSNPDGKSELIFSR